MKGDFTRDIFDVRKHYTRVLMQQGRVQLDADWNAQISMLLHYLQTLAADLIGPHGGPEANNGFQIISHSSIRDDFFIRAGHYYVDGILCELNPEAMRITGSNVSNNIPTLMLPGLVLDEQQLSVNDWIEIRDDQGDWYAAQVSSTDEKENSIKISTISTQYPLQEIRRLMSYKKQPDQPQAEFAPEAGSTYLAYLDVWEHHVTQLDDPHIHEVALGSADTTTRAKIVQQVKVMKANACDEVWNLSSLSSARMRAQLKQEDPSSDPCIISPNSKYRGPENQLYRVEIHEVKTNEKGQITSWSFKWSCENGSVEASQIGTTQEGGLIVSTTRGFSSGQWIEVTSEVDELHNRPGQLIKIDRIDADAIYFESRPVGDPGTLWKLRRWDQRNHGDTRLNKDGLIPGAEEEWLDLENGIQVYFEKGGQYRSGDYWLIPARVTTGQIEWPWELNSAGRIRTDTDGDGIPAALAPHGIKHHYAPLALLSSDANGLTVPEDCRNSFSFRSD